MGKDWDFAPLCGNSIPHGAVLDDDPDMTSQPSSSQLDVPVTRKHSLNSLPSLASPSSFTPINPRNVVQSPSPSTPASSASVLEHGSDITVGFTGQAASPLRERILMSSYAFEKAPAKRQRTTQEPTPSNMGQKRRSRKTSDLADLPRLNSLSEVPRTKPAAALAKSSTGDDILEAFNDVDAATPPDPRHLCETTLTRLNAFKYDGPQTKSARRPGKENVHTSHRTTGPDFTDASKAKQSSLRQPVTSKTDVRPLAAIETPTGPEESMQGSSGGGIEISSPAKDDVQHLVKEPDPPARDECHDFPDGTQDGLQDATHFQRNTVQENPPQRHQTSKDESLSQLPDGAEADQGLSDLARPYNAASRRSPIGQQPPPERHVDPARRSRCLEAVVPSPVPRSHGTCSTGKAAEEDFLMDDDDFADVLNASEIKDPILNNSPYNSSSSTFRSIGLESIPAAFSPSTCFKNQNKLSLDEGPQADVASKSPPKSQTARGLLSSLSTHTLQANSSASPPSSCTISNSSHVSRVPPFLRVQFPATVPPRSPISGLDNKVRLLTCFRVVEALRAYKSQSSAPSPILVELYAHVTSSSRKGNLQELTFADLFFPARPPYLEGFHTTWRGRSVREEDTKAFIDASSLQPIMCRAILKLTATKSMKQAPPGGTSCQAQVLNVWAASWEDVSFVKGIVVP